jgi:hypothetical protein
LDDVEVRVGDGELLRRPGKCVTWWPTASACSTTSVPVAPAAPRTVRFMGLLLSMHDDG